MQNHTLSIAVLTGLIVVAAFAPAAATEGSEIALQPTPPQYHGPYYPSALPRDTDNDLVLINDTETPAAGEIVHLSGRIFDLDGNPVANALVELWQTDSAGVYLHHDSPNRSDYDRNFQGFGRVLTGPSGEYYFRTVRPATHIEKRMRRAPHMHLGVFVEDKSSVFTQLYFEGEMLNERDPILNSVHDPEQKALLVVPVVLETPGPGEFTVTFDIVMRFRDDG
jgi:protocatechuate 3,4-dioxygenase beta subunit